MAALSITVSLTRNSFRLVDQVLKNAPAATLISRNLSSIEVSKNMELFSDKKLDTKVSNLKLTTPQDKPLVVFLSWLLAKRKSSLKYINIYVDQGFDVLHVTITPWQLLWPKKGTQKVSREVLDFLLINHSYSPLLLHGFSVGGYLWSEALVHVAQNQKHFQPLVDRVCGQIWDSAADITEIPIGVPYAVFPKNKVMQNALRQYMMYHLKTFHKVATIHYLRGSQMFHTNLIKAPALFLLSKSDPIGAFSSNMRVRESWESMGIPVYWKCWDRSPHVSHFRYHPKEYKEELFAFLDRLPVLSNREKVQMKI